MIDMNLTPSQHGLLLWLSESEYSQYGECHGQDLDRLVELGLVQIHKAGENTEGFIAVPRSARQLADPMYQAVSLTPAGRTLCLTV